MKTRGHVMARHANRRWRTLGAGAACPGKSLLRGCGSLPATPRPSMKADRPTAEVDGGMRGATYRMCKMHYWRASGTYQARDLFLYFRSTSIQRGTGE